MLVAHAPPEIQSRVFTYTDTAIVFAFDISLAKVRAICTVHRALSPVKMIRFVTVAYRTNAVV